MQNTSAEFYLNKLDAYVWHLEGDCKDLEAFRIHLTACILTVAASSDSTRPNSYAICCKEYRRLVANAMFERKIDMEHISAHSGSYWLSDISWTLSGYAIRRSTEFRPPHMFTIRLPSRIEIPPSCTQEQLQNAIDSLGVLYMLHVSDP